MGKLRTRQHLIEDLSYNFVQRCVLKAFCVFQTYPTRQYSYDAQILTFNGKGETEKGLLFVQVKATDHLQFSEKHNGFILPLDKRDLELWIGEIFPVLIILFDAIEEALFYVELGEYFRKNKIELERHW